MKCDVAVVMGSQSDWETMKFCAKKLEEFNISHMSKVVSAHRTPELMCDFAKNAKEAGFKIIIAGAGGAAHLPGMIAALTPLPVIGVPVKSKTLQGIDSLLSIVQMPKGVSVATMSIGESGAINAAIMAASILALNNHDIQTKLDEFRKEQTQKVADHEYF